jgi:hypothetical protein
VISECTAIAVYPSMEVEPNSLSLAPLVHFSGKQFQIEQHLARTHLLWIALEPWQPKVLKAESEAVIMILLLLVGVVSGAIWEELRCTGKFVNGWSGVARARRRVTVQASPHDQLPSTPCGGGAAAAIVVEQRVRSCTRQLQLLHCWWRH